MDCADLPRWTRRLRASRAVAGAGRGTVLAARRWRLGSREAAFPLASARRPREGKEQARGGGRAALQVAPAAAAAVAASGHDFHQLSLLPFYSSNLRFVPRPSALPQRREWRARSPTTSRRAGTTLTVLSSHASSRPLSLHSSAFIASSYIRQRIAWPMEVGLPDLEHPPGERARLSSFISIFSSLSLLAC